MTIAGNRVPGLRAIWRAAWRSWLLKAVWASERPRAEQRTFRGGENSIAEAHIWKWAGQVLTEDADPEDRQKCEE